jgi:hypothetical protein
MRSKSQGQSRAQAEVKVPRLGGGGASFFGAPSPTSPEQGEKVLLIRRYVGRWETGQKPLI